MVSATVGVQPWTSSAQPEQAAERNSAADQLLSLGEKHLLERVEAAVRPRPPFLAFIAGIGPGILVMLADTDAGNVVTAARCGSPSLPAADIASSSAIITAAAGHGSWRPAWSWR